MNLDFLPQLNSGWTLTLLGAGGQVCSWAFLAEFSSWKAEAAGCVDHFLNFFRNILYSAAVCYFVCISLRIWMNIECVRQAILSNGDIFKYLNDFEAK